MKSRCLPSQAVLLSLRAAGGVAPLPPPKEMKLGSNTDKNFNFVVHGGIRLARSAPRPHRLEFGPDLSTTTPLPLLPPSSTPFSCTYSGPLLPPPNSCEKCIANSSGSREQGREGETISRWFVGVPWDRNLRGKRPVTSASGISRRQLGGERAVGGQHRARCRRVDGWRGRRRRRRLEGVGWRVYIWTGGKGADWADTEFSADIPTAAD